MTILIATYSKLTEESEFLANEHGGTEVVQQVKVHEFPQCLVAGEIPADTRQLPLTGTDPGRGVSVPLSEECGKDRVL